MKKGIKITLIVVPVLILVIGAASFGGTLLYTKNNVDYSVGDASLTSYIFPSSDSFLGYIVVSVPMEIINDGLYNIEDLKISLTVFGQAFTGSTLNGLELGTGENMIGSVAKKTTWSGNLEINMTQNIAVLAVQDGEMRIAVDISLKLDFGLFKTEQKFADEQIKEWNSPFGF
ncbi:MAG: hypothetical protein GF308_01345 [Candidatus Heimdallarchaeota archaeon]|nr:hypothetical protein [Candidatus Heimdallarchaeota archaeon]